jgi:hypothetical protein
MFFEKLQNVHPHDDKDVAVDEKNDCISKKKKLKLADSFIAGLITHMSTSAKDKQYFAKEKEIARLKTSSGGGTKSSTKQSGNIKSSAKDNTDKSWLVNFACTTKKDSNGDAYEWCKLCGPGRSKRSPAGKYMKSPHNHKEWLANKKAKQEGFKTAKKKKKPQHDLSAKHKDTDTGTAEKASTDSMKLKLKIADSIVEGLTTHMSISAHDARTFVKNQLAEFDAD